MWSNFSSSSSRRWSVAWSSTRCRARSCRCWTRCAAPRRRRARWAPARARPASTPTSSTRWRAWRCPRRTAPTRAPPRSGRSGPRARGTLGPLSVKLLFIVIHCLQVLSLCFQLFARWLDQYEPAASDFPPPNREPDTNPPPGFRLLLQLHTKSEFLRLVLSTLDEAHELMDRQPSPEQVS